MRQSRRRMRRRRGRSRSRRSRRRRRRRRRKSRRRRTSGYPRSPIARGFDEAPGRTGTQLARGSRAAPAVEGQSY
eukprot:4623868-Pyramimonas_sp.AAC.1